MNMRDIMNRLEAKIEKETGRKYVSSASLVGEDILISNMRFVEYYNTNFVISDIGDDRFTLTYHSQPIEKIGWFKEMYGDLDVHIRIQRRPGTTECMYDIV